MLAVVKCLPCCIVVHQGGRQNEEMEDLMRAPEVVEFVWNPTLWYPKHVDNCSQNVKASSDCPEKVVKSRQIFNFTKVSYKF